MADRPVCPEHGRDCYRHDPACRVPQDEAERFADEILGPPVDSHVSRAYAPDPSEDELAERLTEKLLALIGPAPFPFPSGPIRSPRASWARGAAAWRAGGDGSPRWDDDIQAWHEGFEAAAQADEVRPYGSPY